MGRWKEAIRKRGMPHRKAKRIGPEVQVPDAPDVPDPQTYREAKLALTTLRTFTYDQLVQPGNQWWRDQRDVLSRRYTKGLKGQAKADAESRLAEDLNEHPVYKAYHAVYDAVFERRQQIEAMLPDLALKVKPKRTEHAWFLVRMSDAGAYASQGYGASRYAREHLKPTEAALKAAGIEYHVNAIAKSAAGTTYGLWAACEPWCAEALTRRMEFTDVLKAYGECANVRVLHPLLCMDHDLADKLIADAGRVV